MPNIPQEKRKLYADEIKHFEDFHASHITDGELNYLITSLCHSVIKRQGLCYSVLNMITGVLKCVSEELYRKVISPYEDKKAEENGPASILDTSGHGYSAEQRRALEETR